MLLASQFIFPSTSNAKRSADSVHQISQRGHHEEENAFHNWSREYPVLIAEAPLVVQAPNTESAATTTKPGFLQQLDNAPWLKNISEKKMVTKEPLRRDVLREIGVTRSLLLACQLINYSLVEIKKPDGEFSVLARLVIVEEEEEMGKNSAETKGPPSKIGGIADLLRAAPVEPAAAANDDGHRVCLSPALAFELGITKSTKKPRLCLRRYFAFVNTDSKQATHSTIRGTLLPVASSVTLSRVSLPGRTGDEDAMDALKDYFEHPRLLHDGQVIAVPLFPHSSGAQACRKWLLQDALYPVPGQIVDSSVIDGSQKKKSELRFSMDAVMTSFLLRETASTAAEPSEIPFTYFRVEKATVNNSEDSKHMKFPKRSFLVDRTRTTLTESGATVASAIPFHLSTFLQNEPVTPKLICEDVMGDAIAVGEVKDPLINTEVFKSLTRLLAPSFDAQLRRVAPSCSVLVTGTRGAGKRTVVSAIAREFGLHLLERNMYDFVGGSEAAMESKLSTFLTEATEMGSVLVHLRQLGAIRGQAAVHQKEDAVSIVRCLKDFIRNNTLEARRVILVGSCESTDDVTGSVAGCFTFTVAMESPDTTRRRQVIEGLLASHFTDHVDNKTKEMLLTLVSRKTAGLNPGQLQGLVAEAGNQMLLRVQHEALMDAKGMQNDMKSSTRADYLTEEDFTKAIDSFQALVTSTKGTIATIPNVKWDDVGGLEHVKREILDTIELPLQHPELFASGLKKRTGVLLFGPPGTGKTLIAKAVATECGLNFMSVKGPELLNMYIGESEKNVRDVFQRARDAKPCVLFFDEMDALAPNRGQGSDSGGVMDRVVSQLLTELDGMNSNSDVFIIAATNRPDLIEPGLLRPGRLDRCVYLGVSSTHEAQLSILTALTRKFNLAPNTNLMNVVQKCPFTFTGADMYAVASDAMLVALKRKIGEIKQSADADFDASLVDTTIFVEEEDFEVAVSSVTPSLSSQELRKYEALRDKFAAKSVR